MNLTSGTRLGAYEIVNQLGEGGMGVVYRARDTRLGREVAIKVLSQYLSTSPEARGRFEREARTISQLNHPHICTLYDIGSENDTDYLVMEFIEGESLAHRLEKGALPINEVLKLAGQIADALGKAHEAGVVHRDLKPGNLMLTKSGIKLLDFGLSRPATPFTDTAPTQTKTMDSPLTTRGEIIGTLAYLSPEQLEGKEVDARADIFALGCVLFEMTTGERLFDGSNSVKILSAILHISPEVVAQRSQPIPSHLQMIIGRCLEKDASKRFANAGEFGEAVKKLQSWARNEAIPELVRIIDKIQAFDEGPEAWSAFSLASEIAQLIPDEPQLERLWPEFSRQISITSDPPGASVFIQRYGAAETDWVNLGTTSMEAVRFPRGITRVRLELPEFRTAHDIFHVVELTAFGATDRQKSLWHFQLVKPGEIPDEMERVPAGQFPLFMPGVDHLPEEPMASFLYDRHPVTNREYKAFVDAGGYRTKEYWQEPFIDGDRTLSWEVAITKFTDLVGQPGPAFWEFGEYPQGEDALPVVGVSWYEAVAYAAWAKKTLPSIFHWNRTAFAIASSQIIPFANFSNRGPVPVGSTRSVNRFGVHDLAGNVREWVWNEYDKPGNRMILGGGWNDPEYAFTDAYAQSAFDRSRTNGFRCTRTIGDEPNQVNLTRKIDFPFRDFRKETPVSDDVFSFFVRQFTYDKTPLNAVIEAEEDTLYGKRQMITFPAAYGGEPMVAYLYLPANPKPPLQTVIIFPGSLAIHVRTFGSGELRRTDFLLKSGRAVLHPVYKGTYQRGGEMKSDYQEETAFYKDHVIMWYKDLARSIDYLETRSDIDADKLAYYGISWGGAMGAIMPAVEKRIKANILYVAGLLFQRALPEADQINYITRVKQPTLMLNGEHDFYFPVETSQKPMFDLLGTPAEHKKRLTYSLGHSVPRSELIKEVLAWLDRYLGPVA